MAPKIDSSQPRRVTTPRTETPKKPATPAKAATTAATKAGWGAVGAGKAGKVTAPRGGGAAQVKLLSAKISDDIGGATAGFPAPQGFTVAAGEDKRSQTMALVDGRTAKFSWDSATLSARTADGKTIELVGKDDAGFQQYASDFNDNYKNATKDDLQYDTQAEWEADRGFTGFGTAGKLVSVSQADGDYTGGAHPNHGTQLKTFDLSTGKQVTLDQLLTKDQFKSICDTIKTTLPRLKGSDAADGIDGSTFQPYQDLAKHVGENFAVTTDAHGKPQITVAWESGVHALGGEMAAFTFAAPSDAAFKAKAGLE